MSQEPISTRICHKNNTVCPQAQPYLQLGGHRNTFDQTEKPNIPAFLVSKSGLKTNCCVSQSCHLSSPFIKFLTSSTRKLMENPFKLLMGFQFNHLLKRPTKSSVAWLPEAGSSAASVDVAVDLNYTQIFCTDVPIRPDTKIGYFWSCDLGSQWGCKKWRIFWRATQRSG